MIDRDRQRVLIVGRYYNRPLIIYPRAVPRAVLASENQRTKGLITCLLVSIIRTVAVRTTMG
jgi:hypothetical protein